jgi:DNA replication protein DnaC
MLPTEFTQYGLDTVRFVEARAVAATYKTAKVHLMSVGVLAIDDVGTEPAEVVDYGNVIEPITELLEARYARGLFTLVTTNLTGKELRQRYGVRLVDRMNEMMHVIVFRNESFR